jgi:integrase
MQNKELAQELTNIASSLIKIASICNNDNFNYDDVGIDNKATMGNRLHINIIKKGDNSPIENNNKEVINLQRGSITKRSDGRYMGRYYENKKPVCIYGKTKQECYDKLNKAIKEMELNENKTKLDKSMILNNWYEYYIKMYKQPVLKGSTLHLLNTNYDGNIRNTLGLMPISKITPKIAKDFIDNLSNNNRKKFCYTTLNDMFIKLMDYGLIKINVMALFVPTINDNEVIEDDEEDDKVKYLSDEQLNKIFEVMKNTKFGESKFYNVIQFLLYTGMRKGEALALTWNDIDFEANTIRINKGFSSTVQKIQTTKTKAGNRIIPLFDNARLVLERMNKGKPYERIFNGLNSTSLTTTFASICKKHLGIDTTPHALRHTFISYCVEKLHLDPLYVSYIVGHKSTEMTLGTYTHVSDEKKQEQTQLINNNMTLKLS